MYIIHVYTLLYIYIVCVWKEKINRKIEGMLLPIDKRRSKATRIDNFWTKKSVDRSIQKLNWMQKTIKKLWETNSNFPSNTFACIHTKNRSNKFPESFDHTWKSAHIYEVWARRQTDTHRASDLDKHSHSQSVVTIERLNSSCDQKS